MTDVLAAEAAPTLVPADDIVPAMTADAEPKVQLLPEIITVAPVIVAIALADIVTTGAPPTTPKKLKKPHKKRENEGLSGGTGKARKPGRKLAKLKGASDMPYLAASSNSGHSP